MNEIKNEIIKQSSEVLSKSYDDLIHPSAKPIGQMLSYLPRTIRVWLSKWEKWIINGEESLRLTGEVLKDKLKDIPEERLCEPEPYVAIPAIQQIAYCCDSNELRELYANLLAASMNEDKKWKVHPGYVDIIKQLTPDEAKILKECPRSSNQYKPLIDLKVKHIGNETGESIILRNYSIMDQFCETPQNISMYIENLNRLKIIHVPDDAYITEDRFYTPLIESERIYEEKNTNKLKEGDSFIINKKLFYVTDYGVGFIKCCVD